MRIHRWAVASLSVCLPIATLICGGCQKADEGKKEADENAAADQSLVEEPTPPEPTPKPTIPPSTFTKQQADTNILNVGDAMPNAALRDIYGRPLELHSLFGKKLTVICFWSCKGTSGQQAISELEKYIAKPYAAKGVAVIGINQGDSPQTIKEKVDLAVVKFPILQDPTGAYFNKVALQTLPRVYLLDASGIIIKFDTEYSRSMRRDLIQGIDVALEK